jgi:hypothetical protein
MNFKFKSALVALALLAIGSAYANQEISGKVTMMKSSTDPGYGTRVWLDSTANCQGAGPIGIIRTVGQGISTNEAKVSNMFSTVLAAYFAGKSITIDITPDCTMNWVQIRN